MKLRLSGGRVALIDGQDAELVAPYRWYWDGRYAKARLPGRGRRVVYLHRLIMGKSGGSVDHVNGDGLDNRRANLRHCAHRENCANQRRVKRHSSRFKGVYRRPKAETKGQRRVWLAGISPRGRFIHLGFFATEDEAAGAYDAAAVEHFGKFAATNRSMGLL